MVPSLPGGVVLAPNEQVVTSGSFMFSLAHFFAASKLVLTTQRLAGQRPVMLLGLIPTGSENLSFPLANIASIGTKTNIAVFPLIVGLFLLLGVFDIGRAWFAVLLGLFLLLGAFQAVFYVMNSAGQRLELKIALADKGKAQDFANQINTTIASRSMPDRGWDQPRPDAPPAPPALPS